MPYVGNIPAESYAAFNVQYFTTSATDTYTLDRAVANELDIRLVINNVIQEPGSGKAYTAAGTTLTLSAATAGTDTMYCVYWQSGTNRKPRCRISWNNSACR